MKKFLLSSSLALLALLKTTQTVWAQLSNVGENGETIEVNDAVFDELNPLKIGGSTQAEQLSNPGGILSRILEFAFPIAGGILFVMIVWGGFEILSGAASKKSIDSGRQRITAAIVGFIMLFVSYWIIQLLEIMFGVVIF